MSAGAFADMLLASTKHPGMIVYLDNWLSIGPNSRSSATVRAARAACPAADAPTGINENLAREILELHTLGVNGGYTQADVQALAAIITGWTYERPRLRDLVSDRQGTRTGAQLFEFDADAHEPGAKTLLAPHLRANRRRARRSGAGDLARHPSTARFIATKLCRHYIADAPPPAAVARVERAFRDSERRSARDDGCARRQPGSVGRRRSRSSSGRRNTRSRCCARANIRTLPPGAGIAAIGAMGQRPYAAPGPDGWADIADAWLTADLVWKRLEFAQTYAAAHRARRCQSARHRRSLPGPAAERRNAHRRQPRRKPGSKGSRFCSARLRCNGDEHD